MLNGLKLVRVKGIEPLSLSNRLRALPLDETRIKSGTLGRNLTFNPLVRSQVLCTLSYEGINWSG